MIATTIMMIMIILLNINQYQYNQDQYDQDQHDQDQHNQDQYNHTHQVRWPRLKAEPRLCLDAQGESEGWGDQQDDPGEYSHDDHDDEDDHDS